LRAAGDDRNAVFQIIDVHNDSPLAAARRQPPSQLFPAGILGGCAENRVCPSV
jgi:hypothetical protein